MILPAEDIPDQTVVFKPTGEKQYRLLKSLVIYTKRSDVQVSYPKGEFIFLHGNDGNINMIGAKEMLAIQFNTYAEVAKFLQKSRIVFGKCLRLVYTLDMTCRLHNIQRLAHKVALIVYPKEGRFLVTNGGTPKDLRETTVDTLEEVLEIVMAERNGRTPILKGDH